MAYKAIGQYGLIGDMNSAALVGTDGSIDGCCFPRFDSASVFVAILDGRRGGRFLISPDGVLGGAGQSGQAGGEVGTSWARRPMAKCGWLHKG